MENKHIHDLIEDKKFKRVKEELSKLDMIEIVDIIEELGDRDEIIVFKLLPKDLAAAVFSRLEASQQESIIRASTDQEVAKMLDSMFIDEMVDIVEEMPANAVTKILRNTSPEDRATINQILRYPEDSAGSIMTTEFVGLGENVTVRDALGTINKIGKEVVSVYVTYVIDETMKLQGYVPLRDILMADGDALIKDIMEEDVSYIHTLEDREEAMDRFKKYSHSIMPVVDEEMRMVGIITVDDILDVMEEEDTEDFQKMNAIIPNEDRYITTSPLKISKNRLPWLVLLMLTSSISGSIIASFSSLVGAYVILNTFVPMLMGTGGNAGNQSSTMIIRGISTGEIELEDWKRVLAKETQVSLILGLTLVLANSVKMLLLEGHPLNLTLIVSSSMFLTLFLANIFGSLVPMLVKRSGMDPANVASPLLTTVVDIISLLIFFNIASAVLL